MLSHKQDFKCTFNKRLGKTTKPTLLQTQAVADESRFRVDDFDATTCKTTKDESATLNSHDVHILMPMSRARIFTF